MTFYQYFQEIIRTRLSQRKTLVGLVNELKAEGGKFAIFPANRLAREIVKTMRAQEPTLERNFVGCYDDNLNAVSEEEVEILDSRTAKDQEGLKTIVLATTTFSDKKTEELRKRGYHGKIKTISLFDTSLGPAQPTEEILENLNKVYSLFGDRRSRATYMAVWLSRLCDDRDLTHLFEQDIELDIDQEPLEYRGSLIRGLDRTVKKELLGEIYNTKEVHPEKGNVVIDAGAYKGDSAFFFAEHVRPDGRVYAFEPVRKNFEDLVANIRRNGMQRVIIPVQTGLSDESCEMNAFTTENGAPWAFLNDEAGGERVALETLDQFVEDNGLPCVDMIKADVEGYEAEVIRGASETIKTMRPKLAFSIYHRTSDLIDLPLQVNKFGIYDLFIRSRMEGAFGFTLFARPRRQG